MHSWDCILLGSCLVANIGQWWKPMEVVNDLAYLETVYITAVKRLMVLAPGYANFNGIF